MSDVLPRRGDIWWINLDATVGIDVKKRRPALVVSSDAASHLSMKVIVPLKEWNDEDTDCPWHVRVFPSVDNGLQKEACLDASELRTIPLVRFQNRLGRLNAMDLEEVAQAIAIIIEL